MNTTFSNKMYDSKCAYQVWEKILEIFEKTSKMQIKQLKEQLKLIKKDRLTTAEAIFEGLNEEYAMLFFYVMSKSRMTLQPSIKLNHFFMVLYSQLHTNFILFLREWTLAEEDATTHNQSSSRIECQVCGRARNSAISCFHRFNLLLH
ncbi:hypothetical protein PIB30_065009 [Stylosanthes scabra]|uniref:Uncharacterized protein n=1 Tax=Stylosanthes scabra TaxID=79078 RepID=A0ABU6WPP0_9FABA|nr:hypothetical protein [Stylosanthes scabra]